MKLELARVAAPLVFVAAHIGAAQAPPSTDVYLAPITLSTRSSTGLAIGSPTNITHRTGYDNQPAFMSDERAVYFTSTREDGQADIYRYDIATRQTTRVTATPESEYSAGPVPGSDRFSVVRVEPDSTQRLWSFKADGSDPKIVLQSVKPVGYYAWLDTAHVALFVLGRPATLQVATLGTEHVDTVARDIARSITPAGPRSVSFDQGQADGSFVLSRLDLDLRSGHSQVRPIAVMPKGAEFVAWTSAGAAVTATGSTLFLLQPGHREWQLLADLAGDGIANITRLAISPNGHWLAFVADDGKR